MRKYTGHLVYHNDICFVSNRREYLLVIYYCQKDIHRAVDLKIQSSDWCLFCGGHENKRHTTQNSHVPCW